VVFGECDRWAIIRFAMTRLRPNTARRSG